MNLSVLFRRLPRQSLYQLYRVSQSGPICRNPNLSMLLGSRKGHPFSTSTTRRVDSSSSAKLPPGPITRELFIDPNYEKIALQGKMWVTEGGMRSVDIPQAVVEKGEIPEGYSVDFVIDPLTAIEMFAKIGITDQSQLSQEMVNEMRSVFCNPSSLSLMPTNVHELRMALAERRQITIADDGEDGEADRKK